MGTGSLDRGARPQRARRWWARFLAALAAVALVASCSSIRYVTQAAVGGATILCKRTPIEKVLRRDDLAPERRRKLEAALQMREFAVRELGLPDNRSYRTFVELERDVVTWNVVAAPELSVEPLVWCFPIAGCVSYRGYFSERRARAYAQRLERDGFDVAITGAVAYSTLGWFADPLLDTFLRYPDWQLAGLVFHELSHQVAYVPGDTTFNESFATAVEELGVERWLALRADPAEEVAAEAAVREERLLFDTLLHARGCLDELYRSDLAEDAKRERKAALLADLHDRLAGLRASGELSARFEPWLAEPLDNADLAAVADYEALVPAFRSLFELEGGFGAFYDAVRALAELDQPTRTARLEDLAPGSTTAATPRPCPPRSALFTEARGARGTAAPDPGSR